MGSFLICRGKGCHYLQLVGLCDGELSSTENKTYADGIVKISSLPSIGLYLTGSNRPSLSVVRGEYCGVEGINNSRVRF